MSGGWRDSKCLDLDVTYRRNAIVKPGALKASTRNLSLASLVERYQCDPSGYESICILLVVKYLRIILFTKLSFRYGDLYSPRGGFLENELRSQCGIPLEAVFTSTKDRQYVSLLSIIRKIKLKAKSK